MPVTEERYDDDIEMIVEHDEPEYDFLADDDEQAVQHIAKPTVWQMIRRFFYQSREERDAEYQARLYLLNEAIETYPTAAVNYLLRGELHLELKLNVAAKSDFEQALELAEKQFEDDRWGLSTQAIRDRAQRGLHWIG